MSHRQTVCMFGIVEPFVMLGTRREPTGGDVDEEDVTFQHLSY